ncbi:endopeptidase [Mycobacterium parmense]|nr:endopeptidase [Mycobacterium parmense]ORW56786.1 endopeptidase [Mycobacterium parmense]
MADPPAPLRPRIHSWVLTIAALCSAAVLVAAACLLRRTADPPPDEPPPPATAPIDLPVAGAIGPGAGIYVDYEDGSGGIACTAGFLVRTSTGRAGVLTAGHCNRPGEASKVTMNLAGILPYATLGTFTETVDDEALTDKHDIGLIMLDGDNIPRTSAIGAALPVSGVASNLELGDQLCKFGMTSNAAACGEVVEVTDSKVVFLAPGKCGDSGGPVYLMRSDGTASAVGIHVRGGDPKNPNAGCSAPATFSVAEQLRPWLDKWNLTVVTTAPGEPR